jgi:hypothetical protein
VYRGEVTAKDNIPYPRQEFTSSNITASFILHLSTLKGYGLDENKSRFLQAWALYKIDRLLHEHLRLRTACEFQVLGIKVMLEGPEGQSQDLGDDSGKWPSSPDILNAFSAARDRCFPRHTDGDEWAQRRVVVVTYALNIVGKEALSEGLSAESFDLEGFTDRAEVKQFTEGKGNKKKTFQALVITGEWPEEDQQALLAKNPVQKENDGGEEVDNPAHDVIKKALKKWNDAWKKVQKKTAGTEEAEDQQ